MMASGVHHRGEHNRKFSYDYTNKAQQVKAATRLTHKSAGRDAVTAPSTDRCDENIQPNNDSRRRCIVRGRSQSRKQNLSNDESTVDDATAARVHDVEQWRDRLESWRHREQSKLRRLYDDIRLHKARLHEERRSVRERIALVEERERAVEESEQRCENERSQLERRQLRLESVERHRAALHSRVSDAAVYDDEHDQRRSRLDQRANALDDAERLLYARESAVAQRESDIVAREESIQQVARRVEDDERRLARLRTELSERRDEWRSALNDLNAESSDASERVEHRRRELDAVVAELEAKRAEFSSLSSAIDIRRGELSDVESRLVGWEAELTRYETRLIEREQRLTTREHKLQMWLTPFEPVNDHDDTEDATALQHERLSSSGAVSCGIVDERAPSL